MRTVKLVDVTYALPELELTNERLAQEHPDWNLTRLGKRTGVDTRRIAAEGETALDLAVEASRQLFAAHPEARETIDAVLFCTQSPDYVMPPNSALLHAELELADSVFALDFTLACSGYPYGLAMARGLAAAGTASSILLVTGDTYSRYINPGDRSARVLFGDGAAVTWLVASEEPGVVDVTSGTVGSESGAFRVPAGGCRVPHSSETAEPRTDAFGNTRSQEDLHMNGRAVLEFVGRVVPPDVRALLSSNGLSVQDVDQFIFHQASAMALDLIDSELGLDPERSYRNLARVGNTVSSSIPMALADARREGVLSEGDLVVLSGFGVGLSFGSALVRI